jgi:hypothetical protein
MYFRHSPAISNAKGNIQQQQQQNPSSIVPPPQVVTIDTSLSQSQLQFQSSAQFQQMYQQQQQSTHVNAMRSRQASYQSQGPPQGSIYPPSAVHKTKN